MRDGFAHEWTNGVGELFLIWAVSIMGHLWMQDSSKPLDRMKMGAAMRGTPLNMARQSGLGNLMSGVGHWPCKPVISVCCLRRASAHASRPIAPETPSRGKDSIRRIDPLPTRPHRLPFGGPGVLGLSQQNDTQTAAMDDLSHRSAAPLVQTSI